MTPKEQALEKMGQDYQYGFHDPTDSYAIKTGKGLTREVVEAMARRLGYAQAIATAVDSCDAAATKSAGEPSESSSAPTNRWSGGYGSARKN